MIKFDLRPDEAVIVPNKKIRYEKGGFHDELVLTNYDVIHIHQYKTGWFSKDTEIKRYSVRDIKIYEGKVQAMLDKSGNYPKLVIYFTDKFEEYYFQSKKEVNLFLEGLGRLLTGNPKGYVSEPMFSFPGSEFVAEAIKGTMDTITDFLGINKPSTPTMVTKKCISCGANIEGVSGTICKCPFCGTSQEL